MQIACHGTSLALESNNVTLDPELKDAWGLPAMRVTYKDHPDDLATARFLIDRGIEILEAAGAQRTTKAPVAPSNFGVHLLARAAWATIGDLGGRQASSQPRDPEPVHLRRAAAWSPRAAASRR